MQTVTVNLGVRSYAIRIGHGIGWAPAWLKDRTPGRVLVVSDDQVFPRYGQACLDALTALGWRTGTCILPAGESSKSLAMLETVYGAAIGAGLDRQAVMLALGGGVVGDLTGFAAATYLRGVAFVQMPTTLLAMVDSSVGGKTGVNLPQGKNLVGAFYQPHEVWMELNTLSTLSEREYRSGLAEIVKYGVIRDVALFEKMERNADRIRQRDGAMLESLIARSCEIKAEVVSQDEQEGGLRAILNFGHTLGHALETSAGYGHWTHGEAVALGMVYAARLSVETMGLPEDVAVRLVTLMDHLGLPVCLPETALAEWPRIRALFNKDKKSQAGTPNWVLVRQPGCVVTKCQAAEPVMERVFRSMIAAPRQGKE